jgi:hypothetical protein
VDGGFRALARRALPPRARRSGDRAAAAPRVDTIEARLDGSSFETGVEFIFEERDGKTLMTMTQRGFPTAELGDEHRVGLPNAFARLGRAVGS